MDILRWHDFPVIDAVQQVKRTNSLLLVFVVGDPEKDEFSRKFDELYGEGIPQLSLCSIPLKIRKDSEEFVWFQKIYCSVPVPSLFIIGKNGTPLTILTRLSPEEMIQGLKHEIECIKPNYNPHDESDNVKASFDKARIQFRLPSDRSRSWDFPSKSTLRDVRLFLMDNVRLGPGFKLVSSYPRRTFTPEEESQTLESLSLTPTATLIVVPEEGMQANLKKMIAKNSLLYTFFTALFKPVLSVFTYIQGFWGMHRRERIEKPKRSRKGPVKRYCKKNPGAGNNIHSFAFDDSESDSDMNMDNGNSTQQK